MGKQVRIKTSVSLDPDLREELDHFVDETGINQSDVISNAIAAYVGKEDYFERNDMETQVSILRVEIQKLKEEFAQLKAGQESSSTENQIAA